MIKDFSNSPSKKRYCQQLKGNTSDEQPYFQVISGPPAIIGAQRPEPDLTLASRDCPGEAVTEDGGRRTEDGGRRTEGKDWMSRP